MKNHTTEPPKIKNPIKTWDRTFFRRVCTDGQETYETMAKITYHHGNAHQKNNEIITSHLKTWLSSKTQQITSLGEDEENPHAFSWECSLMQPLCKTVHRFLKKLKIRPEADPIRGPENVFNEDPNADPTEALIPVSYTHLTLPTSLRV